MNRRELIRLGGSTMLYSGLAATVPTRAWPTTPAGPLTAAPTRLFFETSEIPGIRANAASPLLRPMYTTWAEMPIDSVARALDQFEKSGDMIRDFQTAVWGLEQSAMVQLVDPSGAREKALVDAITRIIAYPKWDYFLDGGTDVLGIQRASFTTVRLLLTREVLSDAIGANLESRLLQAIADKGCVACFNTVYDMDHPETVSGWDFDTRHAGFYDITMERWPTILGANNLRAAPTGALGLGALALRGVDDRATHWLDTAVASTRRFLKLVSSDGSYFEGLSYLSYSLRTLLPFIAAHTKLVGDVDWTDQVNVVGMLEYIMTMQLGKTEEGQPDIVNFSDARTSVSPGCISRLGDYSGSPLAGYAARYAGFPRWYFDLLWYRPDDAGKPPRPALLNKRNDLNWIICRSGWGPDDTIVAFKSGGPANHEHADRNHITLKSRGERLLNDHLGAAYDRRDPGWKLRYTEAHNAVLIDGRGHPYLDGSEGTNDSKAFAAVLQYEDRGEHIWWTSDASAAYILDNYHAHQVLRSVLFAKPDTLIVIDQVRLRYRPQTVDIRFFPDNADGRAVLSTDGSRFTVTRPGAALHGVVASSIDGRSSARPSISRLDVPADVGDFPCIEVHADAGLTHHIVTVLTVTSPGGATPDVALTRDGAVWSVRSDQVRASIETSAHAPRIVVW